MTVLQRLGVFLMLLFSNPGSRAQDEPLLTPDQLRIDLRFIQDSIAATHPEPGFSADEAQLRQAYQQLAAQLQQPMTRDAAWRLLATLNPVYADAHLAITQPDPYGQSAAHLKAGGTFFPYEMVADSAGTLRIRAELGGARVEQINGVPASLLLEATDKSKSGLVCTVSVWASKMVQSPSENDIPQATCMSPTNLRLLETLVRTGERQQRPENGYLFDLGMGRRQLSESANSAALRA